MKPLHRSRLRRPTAPGLGPAGTPVGLLAVLTTVLLASLLIVPSVAAQASATAADTALPASAFSEVLDIRVVNLEVVVERKGERVRGLGSDDFVLRVDGREVPIEYFSEVQGGTAVVTGREVDAGTVPALQPGEPVSTSYLVFVDDFFSLPTDRDRVLRRLIEQLPNLQPEDRMAVVAYDGREIEMLTSWSQSQEELTRALQKAQRREALGLQRRLERRSFESTRDTLAGFEDSRARFLDANLSVEEEQYAARVTDQVENAVTAATAALRGFAQPPGRKVMLLLSGGWPNYPAQWVVGDPERAVLTRGPRRSGGLFAPLIETANRVGYTIYPIDVPLLDQTVIDASDATLDAGERRFGTSQLRERVEEGALLELAKATGGEAMLNSAALSALERVSADTRSYYWIGFTPDWQGDDRAHDVRIDLREGAGRVRTRDGFSDLSRETEVSMMVESTLRFGDAPGAVPLEVEVGRGKKAGFGKRDVPLKVRLPLDGVTFLPTAEGLVADLELRIAVLDDAGNASDIPIIPIRLKGTEQPEEGDFSVYETTLKMRKKRHDLVVSLYDRLSGQMLSRRTEVPAM